MCRTKCRRRSRTPIRRFESTMSMHRCLAGLAAANLCLLILTAASCAPDGGKQASNTALQTDALLGVQFSDPLAMRTAPGPIKLRGARNEVISFAVQVNRITRGDDPNRPPSVRLTPMTQGTSVIPAGNYSAYQVLLMPVDTNRAGFVRHTGSPVIARRLPRALLPLPLRGGAVAMTSLRESNTPP